MSSIGIVRTEEMFDFEEYMDDAEIETYLCQNEGSSQPAVSQCYNKFSWATEFKIQSGGTVGGV